MNIKPLNIAIDIIDEYYPSTTSAFLTKSINNKNFRFIQVVIINEIYDYYAFEHFIYKDYEVEIIILPKSIMSFTEKHIDFVVEHDLFNSISRGKILRESNSTGEKTQQMYEVLSASLSSFEPINTYKEIFKLSNLINELENRQNKTSVFIIKNKIVHKVNMLVKNQINYTDQIIKLQDSFTNDKLFLSEIKLFLENLGGPITFYSENDILNNIVENEFSLLIETGFTYDDFISLFLIHLLSKLKAITHKIKLSFKLLNDNQYLITIWTENKIIKNHIIPTLNQIFISNYELYNNLKPKYPYYNKKQQIDNLLINASLKKELQLTFSQYILELKLNEEEELSEGYRLSLGMYFSIEIIQALFPYKDNAKKITNLLFEDWLYMSYDTSSTNWNDLELQSHKVVNDLENLYLAQFETLNSNFGDALRNWKYEDKSGLELEQICNRIYNSYKNKSIFNPSLSHNKAIDEINNSVQIILFEVLSILGIANNNKTYIIYAINRLLHEA